LAGSSFSLSAGTGETLSVAVRGFPFTEEPNLEEYPKAGSGADVNVCVLHLYATPDGGSLFKHKLYSYEEISQLGDDIFVLGHYHIDQGVQQIGDQHFINVGAVSRGSLSHDNITRIPKICIVTCKKENGNVSIEEQVVRLKVKPAAEVFILEEREKEEKKMKEAEAFVSHLKETIASDEEITNTESFMSKLKDDKSNIEKEVLKKVEYYINEADIALKDIRK